jgi:hypothetical protein
MNYRPIQPALAFAMLIAVGTSNDRHTTLAATTTVVAQTGQTVPNGNGLFLNFELNGPFLSNDGTATFIANLTGTSGGSNDNAGLYSGNGGPVTQLARKGQAMPGGGTISSSSDFSSSNFLSVSDVGQVALYPTLTGNSFPVSIYRQDGVSFTQIASKGQPAPGGDGTISSPATPAIADSGHVAFNAGLTGTLGGSNNNSAVYRGDGGPLTQIARKGQTAPDGNGSLNLFNHVYVDDAGQVAFDASLLNTLGGTADDYGIFEGSGGQLTQVAREGQIAPDGNGRLSPNEPRSANNTGQVVFRAQLTGTAAPGTDDEGIFRGDGGPLTQVARRGQTAPDSNGRFSGFTEPVLNDAGQSAFSASLSGTAGGANDMSGVFRGSGGTITQIARGGQFAPDGNGKFYTGFDEPDINNHGSVAFQATLTNTIGGSSDNEGIFLYDDILGLRQVVRTRQTLLGKLIVDVRLQRQLYNHGNGLDDWGQVAYWFQLADGYQGIAVWSPTVPGDYNSNGIVDAADYVLWRKSGTQTGYQTWRANFGTTTSGSGSQIANVPEPFQLPTLMVLWAMVFCSRFVLTRARARA